MKNSQLINILTTLTKKEIREFKKWLHSPSHNHRSDVVDLFEYLMSSNHLHSEKFLDKKRVFNKIFPREAYDDARIRQSMHFLLKALEEFFSHQFIQYDPIVLRLALAKIYRHKKLDKPYHKAMKSVEKLLEDSVVQDENYYTNSYQAQMEQYEYISKGKRTSEVNLQQISDTLEISFIIGKLKLACFMLNHQGVYKTEYEFGLIEPILEYIEHQQLTSVPAVKIYYTCYLAYIDKNEESQYYGFRDAIMEHDTILTHAEMRDVFLMAINYCISKLNRGNKDFFREVFELYRKGIENKVLFDDDGTLNHLDSRNIVNIGTLLKEFVWVKQFIDNYQEYIDEQYRGQFVSLSLGKYHFEKGDYNKARDTLVQFNPSDILNNLSVKWMLMRIYYLQEEFQLLESLLESTKTYINRKKVLGYHKESYRNLIRYTRKLMRVNPYDASQKEKLRKDIQNANPLTAKDWFLQQLDQL